jgi:hypothetical protein
VVTRACAQGRAQIPTPRGEPKSDPGVAPRATMNATSQGRGPRVVTKACAQGTAQIPTPRGQPKSDPGVALRATMKYDLPGTRAEGGNQGLRSGQSANTDSKWRAEVGSRGCAQGDHEIRPPRGEGRRWQPGPALRAQRKYQLPGASRSRIQGLRPGRP